MLTARSAYITRWGAFLPNAPVNNSEIEAVLGELPSQSAALKRRVLMSNGITSRHYAVDPATGKLTHSNARLTADAIRQLCIEDGFSIDDIECLACGTSSADQIIPGHASMVHAELDAPPCETMSPAGVCCTGISALKYGYLNVATGMTENAVVTGSELASPTLRASHFEPQIRLETRTSTASLLPFSNAFLRWMLSDGAGALLVEARPNESSPSLRIDWVDLVSYAPESEVCMYFGLQKLDDGSIEGYRSVDDEIRLWRDGFLSLAQDVRVLGDRLPVLLRKALHRVRHSRALVAQEVDWLLPHYSSQWFRQPLHDGLVELEFEIPQSRWFTNLETKGNTGSASIYIMLHELMSTGRARRGDRILCLVPESSRMLFGFAHLTVV